MIPQIYTPRAPLQRSALYSMLSQFVGFVHWAYLESECEVSLDTFDIEAALQFPAGRAFGPEYEARWEAIAPDTYHFEALTETRLEIEHLLPSGLELTASDIYTIHLWGVLASTLPPEHTLSGTPGAVWVETRIPRLLMYPLEPVGRWVGVKAIDYLCDGVIVATRWLELVGLEAG